MEAEKELLLAVFPEGGEVDFGTHMVGVQTGQEQSPCTWRVCPSSGRSAVTLVALLPPGYPAQPAAMSIEAPTLRAGPRQRLLAALADDLRSGSVYGAATRMASLLESETGSGDASAEDEAEASLASVETALVRIDHMNDLKGYLHALERIGTGRSCGARVFWRRPDAGRHAAVDVLLILRAPADTPRGSSAIDTALARLRTEHVDVNSRGSKCKERQSHVLRRQLEQAADAPCFAHERFASARYAEHGELLSMLGSLSGALCLQGVDEAEMRRSVSSSAAPRGSAVR